ncbi:MAG: preprotein translocase subunit SecE [Ruminococcus sp.]|nr:preprotein translocase subunit SecE [Candidatus Copronaster equi]
MAKEKSEAAKKIAAAEKDKPAKNKAKKNKPSFAKRTGKFFKDSKGDLKKISWPTGQEVVKGTLVTIAAIAIIGIVVFLIDLGLTNGIKGLRTVAENRTTTTQVSEQAEAESSAAAEIISTTAATTKAAAK